MPKPVPEKKVSQNRNFQDAWAKTPGRVIGVSLVRFYQLTLSGFVGQSCRHAPTCSEFAYEAIARHGLWAGGWMGLFRLMRCGPGGTHGYDPVAVTLPENLGAWSLPHRYWKVKTPKNQ